MSVKTGNEGDKPREKPFGSAELAVLSDALDRLKGDLASLRASLLGSAEDRGSIALALDRLRSDLSALQSTTSLALEQLNKQEEEHRRTASALETRVREMERAFEGRLEKIEYTGRRFEVFYDSRPLRLLRRLLVGAQGRPDA